MAAKKPAKKKAAKKPAKKKAAKKKPAKKKAAKKKPAKKKAAKKKPAKKELVAPPDGTMKRVHAINSAWEFLNVDAAQGQRYRVTAIGGWKTLPGGPDVPPTGYPGIPAGSTFVMAGALQGALIIKDGANTHYAMTSNPMVIVVGAGKVYGMANDDLSPQDPRHVGFRDNTGHYNVYLEQF